MNAGTIPHLGDVTIIGFDWSTAAGIASFVQWMHTRLEGGHVVSAVVLGFKARTALQARGASTEGAEALDTALATALRHPLAIPDVLGLPLVSADGPIPRAALLLMQEGLARSAAEVCGADSICAHLWAAVGALCDPSQPSDRVGTEAATAVVTCLATSTDEEVRRALGPLDELLGRWTRMTPISFAARLAAWLAGVRAALLGAEHPDTLRCILLSAARDDSPAELNRSLRLSADALPRAERVLGIDAPELGAARLVRARLLRMRGAPEQARTVLEEALERATTVHGEEDERVLDVLRPLATVTGEVGDLTATLALHRRAAGLAERLHGPLSPVTLALRSSEAVALVKGGESEQAERLLEETAGVIGASLGPRHFEALRFRVMRATLLAARGALDARTRNELHDDALGIFPAERLPELPPSQTPQAPPDTPAVRQSPTGAPPTADARRIGAALLGGLLLGLAAWAGSQPSAALATGLASLGVALLGYSTLARG